MEADFPLSSFTPARPPRRGGRDKAFVKFGTAFLRSRSIDRVVTDFLASCRSEEGRALLQLRRPPRSDIIPPTYYLPE